MEYYSHENVGDVSYHQTSSSVHFKTSQISNGCKFPFTDLLMSGTVSAYTLYIKENIFLCLANTVITQEFIYSQS